MRSVCFASLTPSMLLMSGDVSPLLPTDWVDQVRACTEASAQWRRGRSGNVTSREGEFDETEPPEVGVISGDKVARHLPWLADLYAETFLEYANRFGGPYVVSQDIKSSININHSRRGMRYEWHVDSNPLTALLYATTHGPGRGGELVFRPDPEVEQTAGWQVRVAPKAGQLLLFDARRAAHCVTPLLDPDRISVPMNYYLAAAEQERPQGLDAYLYKTVRPPAAEG